jgi:hypothetical protein
MRLSKNYMHNPKTIEIASRNEGAKKYWAPLLYGSSKR